MNKNTTEIESISITDLQNVTGGGLFGLVKKGVTKYGPKVWDAAKAAPGKAVTNFKKNLPWYGVGAGAYEYNRHH
jgi:hypothetical protein